VLGLIRALTSGTEAEAWLSLIPFLQSTFVNWAASNWFYLAIAWILWQLLFVGVRLEQIESRADAQVAFAGAMMNYVQASDVQFADELKRKDRTFGDLFADVVVRGFFRVIFGRWAVQTIDDQLLMGTRFFRGRRQIFLKEDIAAVLKELGRPSSSDEDGNAW
jgi:hypothetical protein